VHLVSLRPAAVMHRRTAALLDSRVDETNETRNSLVERLPAEALRTERHPFVRFRQGAAGRREPMLVGTRLLVRQVMSTLRGSAGVEDVAQTLAIPEPMVLAAVAYYAEFGDEVDLDASWAERAATGELTRWSAQQAALA
jgi:hypothetical protein